MQYAIHEDNMQKLIEKLTRIKNKCKKYGCSFQYAETGDEYREIQHYDEIVGAYGHKEAVKTQKTIERFVIIEVTGKAIINEWEFLATIEHTENGNIIRSYSDIDIPEKYRTVKSYCEHCNTDRYRKDTYLIRNIKTNDIKQVGKSCLMDYTNGLSAEMAASYASYYDEISHMDGEKSQGGFTRHYIDTEKYLLAANEIVKKIGFVSAQKAADDGSTKTSIVINDFINEFYPPAYVAGLKAKINYDPDTEINKAEVKNMLDWLQNQPADSQYISNLQIVCKKEYAEIRDCGLLASLPAAYFKAQEKAEKEAKEKENKPSSEYQGNIGDKITLKNVTIKCIASYETQYGLTNAFKITDRNGNIYVWKTNKLNVERDGEQNIDRFGNTYCHIKYVPIESFTSIKGTIKNHSEYNGEKQTELTRCKVID